MIDPIIKNIEIDQGYEGWLGSIYIPGNYSTANGYTLKFGMKSDISNESEDLTKITTTASEMTSEHADGITDIRIHLDQEDTVNETSELYEYNIWAYNASERILLVKGYVKHNLAVVKNEISVTTPTVLTPTYVARYVFMLVPPDTFTPLIAPVGFNGTLSVALDDSDNDVIIITSDASDFDNQFETNRPRGYVSEWRVSATEFRIRLAPGWEDGFESIIVDFYKRAT